MDNQHRQIKGYRELSQEEIDLMNEIKTKGAELGALVDKINAHADAQMQAAVVAVVAVVAADKDEFEERNRLLAAQPQRWAAIAKTDFQTGLMALTRAVAQPTFF